MQALQRFRFAPLFALLSIGAALPASAGLGVWTPLGPDGGSVTAIAESPASPQTVLAGSENGGVFRSLDSGRTWGFASQGLGATGIFPRITSFAFDPLDPRTVYLGTAFQGAFRSQDGGSSWSPASAGLDPGGYPTVNALAVDPRVSGTVYAATPSGIFRSKNRGRGWERWSRGLPAYPVLDLGFDPPGRNLYAALRGGGVYRSQDGSGTWSAANQGLPTRSPAVFSLGFDPRAPATLYAGEFTGLYRSLDRGRRWSRIRPDLLKQSIHKVGILPATDALYVATFNGIFVSPDHGATWQSPAAAPESLFPDRLALGSSQLYCAVRLPPASGGLARSADGGASWSIERKGISALSVTDLGFHAQEAGTLFLGTEGGTFKSRDGGATWNRLSSSPADPAGNARLLAVDPSAPDTLYAAGTAFVRSTDGGASWVALHSNLFELPGVVEPDPRAPGALWAGGFRAAVHSNDGGDSWEPLSIATGQDLVVSDIEVDPADPNVVTFAGSTLGGFHPPTSTPALFRSEDGGTTWHSWAIGDTHGVAILQVASDRAEPGALYALTQTGLFHVRDSGASWTKLFAVDYRGSALLVTTDALYVGRFGGVFRSTDRGATWSPLRQGLGSHPVQRLWQDPRDPQRLFAGTVNGGLWSYTLAP